MFHKKGNSSINKKKLQEYHDRITEQKIQEQKLAEELISPDPVFAKVKEEKMKILSKPSASIRGRRIPLPKFITNSFVVIGVIFILFIAYNYKHFEKGNIRYYPIFFSYLIYRRAKKKWRDGKRGMGLFFD